MQRKVRPASTAGTTAAGEAAAADNAVTLVTFGGDHDVITFNSLDGAFFEGWYQAIFLLDNEEKLYTLYRDGEKVSESRFHSSYTSYRGHLMGRCHNPPRGPNAAPSAARSRTFSALTGFSSPRRLRRTRLPPP